MLANQSIKKLDKLAAYDEETPIRKASDNIYKDIVTKPMEKDWKDRLANKWWATNYAGELEAEMKPTIKLRNHLLSFGGEEACMAYTDEDFHKIKERGQLWHGDPHIMMKGRPSQCHENASLLWYANKENVLIATGYALSKDGMWRQHSWGVLVDEEDGATIVETTEARVAYYGFVMNKEESLEFYENNT